MTSYSYYISGGRLLNSGSGHEPLSKNELPALFFGDTVAFDFDFEPGAISAGESIEVSVDIDRKFDPAKPDYTAAMASAKHDVTQEEAALQHVQILMPTRFQRFRDVVHGKEFPVPAHMQVVRHRHGSPDIDTLLCDSVAFCLAPVKEFGDAAMILPYEYYYTRDELNDLLSRLIALVEAATGQVLPDIMDLSGLALIHEKVIDYSGDDLTAEAGKAYRWTVPANAAATLSLTGQRSGYRSWTALDIEMGEGAALSLPGIEALSLPEPGMASKCGIEFDGRNAYLHVYRNGVLA